PQRPQGCRRGGGDRGGRSQRLVPAAVLAGPEPDREAVEQGQGVAARRAGRHRGGTGGRRRRRPGRCHARRVRQLPPLLRLPSPRAPFTQAALAVASFLALAASAAAEPPTTRPSNSGTLAQELEEIRRKHGVPALGAALAEDGVISRIAVVGTISAGSDEAVSSEDAWHIGSCAKAMTATLAARLVEQGKISWDTTMSEALPELAGEI